MPTDNERENNTVYRYNGLEVSKTESGISIRHQDNPHYSVDVNVDKKDEEVTIGITNRFH